MHTKNGSSNCDGLLWKNFCRARLKATNSPCWIQPVLTRRSGFFVDRQFSILHVHIVRCSSSVKISILWNGGGKPTSHIRLHHSHRNLNDLLYLVFHVYKFPSIFKCILSRVGLRSEMVISVPRFAYDTTLHSTMMIERGMIMHLCLMSFPQRTHAFAKRNCLKTLPTWFFLQALVSMIHFELNYATSCYPYMKTWFEISSDVICIS